MTASDHLQQPQLFDTYDYERSETGASQRPRPSRVVDRLRAQNQDKETQLDSWADRGLNSDAQARQQARRQQTRSDLGQNVAQEMQGRKPVIRAEPYAAADIMQSGRFKTQFETGDSNGSYDPGYRTSHEERMFGLTAQTPPAARPVYGYLQAPEGHPNRETEEQSARPYGSVEFSLKPERVAHRATVTFGDSLGSRHPAVPLQDAQLGQHIPEDFVETPRYGEMPEGREYHPRTYYEMQIHGGVSTRDVDRVDIMAGKYEDDDGMSFTQVKRSAQDSEIPYAQRRVAQTYQQGGMITPGGGGAWGYETAVTDLTPWGRSTTEGHTPAENMAYRPYMGPQVKDVVTTEQWSPAMTEPQKRTPYPVPKTADPRVRDRF